MTRPDRVLLRARARRPHARYALALPLVAALALVALAVLVTRVPELLAP
jgi:hypothetical protein